MNIAIEADQQTRIYINRANTNGTAEYIPNASQKNIAPDFFVVHHPGRPFTKSSPLDSAFGSLLAFLQPDSVHAEIVTINLK